jgi:hypothetical protein
VDYYSSPNDLDVEVDLLRLLAVVNAVCVFQASEDVLLDCMESRAHDADQLRLMLYDARHDEVQYQYNMLDADKQGKLLRSA